MTVSVDDFNGDSVLGGKIKGLRIKKVLTQSEFADSLGVTQGYISKIENGDLAPNVEFLKKIREIYKINLNRLLSQ